MNKECKGCQTNHVCSANVFKDYPCPCKVCIVKTMCYIGCSQFSLFKDKYFPRIDEVRKE